MRVLCPSCDAEIDAEVPQCPVCLSERSRAEIFQGLRGKDPRRSAWRLATARGLLWMSVGVFGTVGGVRWANQRKADRERTLREQAERFQDGARRQQEGAEELPLSAAAVPYVPEAPSHPAEKAAAAKVNAPAAAASDHWAVSGEAYDLKTLAPAAALRITFTSEDASPPVRATTDREGRYSARLAKKSAPYAVEVAKSGRSVEFVEEDSTPYKDQPAQRRLAALSSLKEVPIIHVPLSPPAEDDSAEFSFVIFR